jgi:hypothetical protein
VPCDCDDCNRNGALATALGQCGRLATREWVMAVWKARGTGADWIRQFGSSGIRQTGKWNYQAPALAAVGGAPRVFAVAVRKDRATKLIARLLRA